MELWHTNRTVTHCSKEIKWWKFTEKYLYKLFESKWYGFENRTESTSIHLVEITCMDFRLPRFCSVLTRNVFFELEWQKQVPSNMCTCPIERFLPISRSQTDSTHCIFFYKKYSLNWYWKLKAVEWEMVKNEPKKMKRKKILFIVVYYFIHIALNDRRKDRHFM